MSLILKALNSVDMADFFLPSGMVSSTIASTVPSGWLPCDGRSLSRATNATLFAAIGTTFGSADGNSFSIPDLRGEFLRGADAGRGLDSGRVLGTGQSFALQQMFGQFNINNGFGDTIQTALVTSGAFRRAGTYGSRAAARTSVNTTVGDLVFDNSRVVRTAGETRPHNLAVTYMIKL